MASDDDLQFLSVRGYQCKLFYDEEKQTDLNSGKSLICWMGVLMDRFDCRGHLTDLSAFDADLHSQESNVVDPLDAAFMTTLDEERFMDLYRDVAEEDILMSEWQDEGKRRAQERMRNDFGAVSFTYENNCSDSSTTESKVFQNNLLVKKEESEEEDDTTYELPPELKLPYNMEVPQSDKIAQIIEKTSQFIAKQGIQMEILIKTKQANNLQFDFLRGEHPLHPFYRFMVSQIKAGRYRLKPRLPKQSNPIQPSSSVDDINLPYAQLPKVDISNTAYALLINKFKKEEPPKSEEIAPPEKLEETDLLNTDAISSDSSDVANPANSNPETHDTEYQAIYENHYRHYFNYYYHYYLSIMKDADSSNIVALASNAARSAASGEAAKVLTLKREQSNEIDATIPDEKDKAIIDKMAEYVARNGVDFEAIVRNKDENRFRFLDADNPLHGYYRKKKREFELQNAQNKAREIIEAKGIKIGENKPKPSSSDLIGNNSPSSVSAISFSLSRIASKTPPTVPASNILDGNQEFEANECDMDSERRKNQQVLLDKVATVVRNKIAEVAKKAKEDEIRAERKRKAELFLTQRRILDEASMKKKIKHQNESLSASKSENQSEHSSRRRSSSREDRYRSSKHKKRSRSRSPRPIKYRRH